RRRPGVQLGGESDLNRSFVHRELAAAGEGEAAQDVRRELHAGQIGGFQLERGRDDEVVERLVRVDMPAIEDGGGDRAADVVAAALLDRAGKLDQILFRNVR